MKCTSIKSNQFTTSIYYLNSPKSLSEIGYFHQIKRKKYVIYFSHRSQQAIMSFIFTKKFSFSTEISTQTKNIFDEIILVGYYCPFLFHYLPNQPIYLPRALPPHQSALKDRSSFGKGNCRQCGRVV